MYFLAKNNLILDLDPSPNTAATKSLPTSHHTAVLFYAVLAHRDSNQCNMTCLQTRGLGTRSAAPAAVREKEIREARSEIQ
jgi:hypothetical protein